MYSIDFEYNGMRLSDVNGLICNISGGALDGAIEYGTDITWNTVKVGNTFMKVSGVYDSAYTTTFQFAKNSCQDMNDIFFSEEEITFIQRWLRQPQYKKFKAIYDDESFSNVYYMGTFTTVNPVVSSGKVVGFELTFTTNAPFGYYKIRRKTHCFSCGI